jgi:hypothetical protein
MKPTDLILWAIFVSLAWIVFASFTGADDWFKSLFGKSKTSDLEKRVAELETRLDAIEKK